MWEPTEQAAKAIHAWGHDKDPFAASKDYSPLKCELRWLNSSHRVRHDNYIIDRANQSTDDNMDKYYREARKTIDRNRWEYLKERKAWYIIPLGWDDFVGSHVTRILDLGCGDGDVVQRIADHIAENWNGRGYEGHELEIVGVDLNESRIENAKNLCKSSHEKIRLKFASGDAFVGLDYTDQYFNYVLSCGVLEILNDRNALKMLNEMARLAKTGLYIEDLADRYPAGYPRENLPELLAERGFKTTEHVWHFTEPFTLEGSADPMGIWPILRDQVLFAVRT